MLRIHAHTIYREFFFSAVKMQISLKIFDILIFLLKTFIVDTRRGGSNEYPQSMFWIKDKKKNMYTPFHPSFTT